MEYTNEFLARVYGAYYGCQYIDRVSNNRKSLEADIISEIHAFGKYKTYQLTLTPLSKITDEDAVYIAQSILGYSDGYHEYFVETGKRYLSKNSNYMDTDREVIDKLREWGYDCGYGDIPSLIEAGIAIDKTTLTT